MFIGCILGSVPALFKKSGISRMRIRDVAWLLAGFSMIYLMSFLPEKGLSMTNTHSLLGFFIMAIGGVVVSIAFILPGLSTSYMLLILGIYESTLNAVVNYDVLYLLPLLIGGAVGTVVTARILETAMRKYTAASYMVIMGFVLGSIFEIVPRIPIGWDILACAIMLAIGFFAIMWVSKYSD